MVFAEIYAQLEGVNCHRYMYIILYIYIYRSAMRCAKFGIAILKASMLDLGVLICHGYMCIVLYMKLIGVMVLQRSMLNWRGQLP